MTVTITDSCPECAPDHMDLQALVFDKIAPMALGRINMKYRRVDCTPPSSLGVKVNNNVGPGGWVRLVVQKTGGPGGVKSVQVKGGESGSWQPMQNKFGTSWEISSAPQLPWDFKFVSDDGQEVIATKAVDKSGRVGDLPLGVQFGPSKAAASSGRKMLLAEALEPAVRELLEAEAPESNAGFGAAFHVQLGASAFQA